MNKSDTCQSKKLQLSKRPFAKKQKKTVFNADKKSQQATLSTFGSRNSAERFKKIVDKSIQTKSKLELRTQKGNHKKHHQKSTNMSQLQLTLMENFENRYFSEDPEDYISFREYYMIEGKWVPMVTQTQRKRLTNLTNLPKNHKEYEKNEQTQIQRSGQSQKFVQAQYIGALQKCQNSPQEIDQFTLQLPIEPMNEESKQEKKEADQIDAIFSKLQFFYLPNQEIFKSIPEHLKDHYSQLLNSLMKKMERLQKTPPTSARNAQDLSPVHKLDIAEKQQEFENPRQQSKQVLRIYEQECRKLGMIMESRRKGAVETDLRNVILTLQTIFQIIKNEYNEKTIMNLKLAYGYEKLRKLSRLLNRQSIEYQLEIVPAEVFRDFEDMNENLTFYQQIHSSCIFDAINKQLQKFKPYFESNGECFPWSLRMCPSITFYQINENSLDIVLMEVKKKVIEDCSSICGLLVDDLTQAQEDQLRLRRIQRQDMMFRKYLKEQEYKEKQELNIELQATLVLIFLGDFICRSLIEEMVDEFGNTN